MNEFKWLIWLVLCLLGIFYQVNAQTPQITPDIIPIDGLYKFWNPHFTVTGTLKKMPSGSSAFYSKPAFGPVGRPMDGFYFPDGKFVFSYDGRPWLSGNFSEGKMVGDWTLWDFDNPQLSVKADFSELVEKQINQENQKVGKPSVEKNDCSFPFLLDLSGDGHEKIMFSRFGELIFDGQTLELSCKPKEKARLNPLFLYLDRISDHGPYCFWRTGIYPRAGVMNGQNEWNFYVFVDGDFKLVYRKIGGEDTPEGAGKVYLGTVDQNGFKTLWCDGSVAHWDDKQKKFF